MRLFWFSCLAAFVVLAATWLLVGSHRHITAQAKEPAKTEEKKNAEQKKPEAKIDPLDEEILRRAKVAVEPDGLIEFLRKRVLPEKDRPGLERLVRSLGSSDYRVREKANRDLIARGVASLDVLRATPNLPPDWEVTRRIERSIQTIHDKDVGPEVPAAAVRALAVQNPRTLIETLLAYLPFADNETVIGEIRLALTKHARKDGKSDPLLLAALSDRSAIRRATAGEVLVRVAYADHKGALRKLLADGSALVRYRVSRALIVARDRDAVPVLIDTLPDLPLNAAWQAEDFLLQLAADSPAPPIAMGNDQEARAKCKTSWHDWWKKSQGKIDLAKFEESPRLLGRTLIVLLDQNTVLELGPDNVPRFEIKGLVFPLDAQVIDDDHILVAEYHANRVTERNTRGDILWQKNNIQGPQVAQRLKNGNTFVATAFKLLEFDKDDNTVVDINLSGDGNQKIMKAMKLDNGEIVCMQSDARIVRYDARGNELGSFPINFGARLFGGRIHMLPNGRVLVPHHQEGKVVEYDKNGKIIWEVPFEQPVVATRLPNGNTLITSMNFSVGAVEVDRTGARVWSYQHSSNSRVTRAIRR